MNLDVSVAPEIAQLIGPGPGRSPRQPARAAAGVLAPAAGQAAPTVGELARQLRLITAAPERWWGLVRFDAERPVRVRIPMDGPAEVWLMIIPPSALGAPGGRGPAGGGWAHGDSEHGPSEHGGGDCGCEVVAVVAGEVTEQVIGDSGVATTPLLPGKMRVHGSGQLHQVINRSAGYTVSVHARARATAQG